MLNEPSLQTVLSNVKKSRHLPKVVVMNPNDVGDARRFLDQMGSASEACVERES
jgi:hypothetical protein